MCLFPKKMLVTDAFDNKKEIECGCGVCPECLKKKSRQWALRCYYESLENPAMMITLTYDNFVYNSRGKIIGERLPDKDLKVNKRDAQLFIKKLRKYIKTHTLDNPKIKYLITAEYGKSTHRPHYHAIIFGYVFEDIIFHKMSKRGNRIYRSNALAKIWGNGICTVDCINITPAVAQYCTKYCSKDSGKQSDDTFMLFSRGIGLNGMLKAFNGKSYIVDGLDYTIPRLVWQKVLTDKYSYADEYAMNYSTGELLPFSFKYRGKEYGEIDNPVRIFYRRANRNARKIRDTDILYQDYIYYWKNKADTLALTRPSIEERIRLLDDQKYHFYKNECFQYLDDIKKGVRRLFVPREKVTRGKIIARMRKLGWKPKEFTTIHSDLGCIDAVINYENEVARLYDWYSPFDSRLLDSYDDYVYDCMYKKMRSSSWYSSRERLRHLRLDTCCISANDTENDFKRYAQRFDLEKEWSTSVTNGKKIDRRIKLR